MLYYMLYVYTIYRYFKFVTLMLNKKAIQSISNVVLNQRYVFKGAREFLFYHRLNQLTIP